MPSRRATPDGSTEEPIEHEALQATRARTGEDVLAEPEDEAPEAKRVRISSRLEEVQVEESHEGVGCEAVASPLSVRAVAPDKRGSGPGVGRSCHRTCAVSAAAAAAAEDETPMPGLRHNHVNPRIGDWQVTAVEPGILGTGIAPNTSSEGLCTKDAERDNLSKIWANDETERNCLTSRFCPINGSGAALDRSRDIEEIDQILDAQNEVLRKLSKMAREQQATIAQLERWPEANINSSRACACRGVREETQATDVSQALWSVREEHRLSRSMDQSNALGIQDLVKMTQAGSSIQEVRKKAAGSAYSANKYDVCEAFSPPRVAQHANAMHLRG